MDVDWVGARRGPMLWACHCVCETTMLDQLQASEASNLRELVLANRLLYRVVRSDQWTSAKLK